MSGRNTQGIDPFYWPQQNNFRVFGVNELFFSPEETGILVQKNLATRLDENALHSLFRLAKGWPAAIKLAQIYYQSSSPQAPLPAVVPGGGSLFRFLLKNSLSTLPPDLVKFLICSSFLEQLTIPLCDHLLGIRNSAQHIKTLVRLGLLMERNLLQPGEFHYHALLQDHLLQEFATLDKAERERLVARACLWRIDHQQRESACRVAHTHGTPTTFTAFLQQCLLKWLLAGEADPVFRWLRVLDADTLRNIPHSGVAKSWSLAMFGEFLQAEKEICQELGGGSNMADCMSLLQPKDGMEVSALGVVYAIIRLFRGTMDEQLAAQLQQLLNHRALSNSHRSSFENLLAGYAIFHCRFEEARERASRAASAMASMGNRLGHALGTYMVANSHYLSNDIKNARLTCTNYLQQPDLDSGATARLLMQSFENYLDYQGLSPLTAENRIQDLLLVRQPAYTVELQLYLTLPLLHMRTRSKDFIGAHFLLIQLEQSARTSGAFQLQVHALYERVRLAYAKGDGNELEQLEQAHELLATGKRLLLSDVTLAWESVERPILAAILLLLHRGDLVQASQWLQQLQYLNVDFGQPIRFLPINLCMAYVEFRLNRISMAYRRLNDTLTQAEATGMLAGLLDDIPGLDDFVKTALEQGRIQNPQHAEKLRNLGFFTT